MPYRGNELYKKKQFKEALEMYDKASLEMHFTPMVRPLRLYLMISPTTTTRCLPKPFPFKCVTKECGADRDGPRVTFLRS